MAFVKKELFSLLMDFFSPYRAAREKIVKETGYVDEIRRKGAEKARAVGSALLQKMRAAVGVA